eukprot:9374376-Lingulodinium_polyedra.AAC.1
MLEASHGLRPGAEGVAPCGTARRRSSFEELLTSSLAWRGATWWQGVRALALGAADAVAQGAAMLGHL